MKKKSKIRLKNSGREKKMLNIFSSAILHSRELFVLANGGIVIDNPGMRELGMTDSAEGIKTTFQEIFELTLKCKFPDCKHVNENGCAVIEAIGSGIINRDSVDNFRKMLREEERFQATLAEKRKKDREFGRRGQNVMKEKNKKWNY